MAIPGDCAPQFTTLAKFVRKLRGESTELFTQVLLTRSAQGLIGRQMFAIDGVKLPSNAVKKRSGAHAYGIPRERAHAKWRSSRNSKLRRCPTPSA